MSKEESYSENCKCLKNLRKGMEGLMFMLMLEGHLVKEVILMGDVCLLRMDP